MFSLLKNVNTEADTIKHFLLHLDYSGQPELKDYVINSHLNRFAETLAFVPLLPRGSILEIGARTPTLAFCQAMRKYDIVEGTRATWELDMPTTIKDEDGAEYSFPFHTFDIGLDAEFPLPDNSYDSVICSEVIEHITFDPAKGLLNEIRRILRPGGLLLLTTPNITSIDSFLRMTQNETPLIHPIFTEVGWLEHPKEYSPLELARKVRQCGFDIEIVTTIVSPYEQGENVFLLRKYLESTNYDFTLSNLFTLILARAH